MPKLAQWSGKIRTGARYFYVKFLQPKSRNEDDKRREFILNIILLGSILLIAILDLVVAYNTITLGENYNGVPFPIFSLILLVFVFLFTLSRWGWFIVSAYLVVALYLSAIIYASSNWGVDLPSAALGYALVIIIGSILVSTKFAFYLTAIISAVVIFLWYWQSSGHLNPQLYWKYQSHIDDVLSLIMVYFLIMIVSWLSNREIERSLNRARQSEAELKEERDLLEIKVEDRTKQLREAQLEKMSELYRFAEFGRLASGLFHDLINPLNAISLQMEQLKQSGQGSDNDPRGYLDRAITASKRMEKFVESVRKQMQNREIHEQFSLNLEIEQVLQVLGYKARKSLVDVIFTAEENTQTYGNPLNFHQLVLNLISNAIDSYEGIESNRPRVVKVTLSTTEPNSVVLIVEDNGSGIKKEDIDKIFDSFYTTKDIDKGTGLGLARTRDIVEKSFEGKIKVKSEYGKGTEFRVEIPINQNNERP